MGTKNRFVYLQQSSFSSPRDCVGFGVLVSEEELDHGLIASGLRALQVDERSQVRPARFKDDETLRRGGFQPELDSDHAREHICTQIRERVDGHLRCSLYDAARTFKQPGGRDDLYKRAVQECFLSARRTRAEVTFLLPEREGTTLAELWAWYAELDRALLTDIHASPEIPALFPAVRLETRASDDAGLQVIEIALWAASRAAGGDGAWLAGLDASAGWTTGGGSDRWGVAELQLGRRVHSLESSYSAGDLPSPVEEDFDKKRLLASFERVEACLDGLAAAGLPRHGAHHEPTLAAVQARRADRSRVEYPAEVGELFLRLFDTLPLVTADLSDDERRGRLLDRRYMALLLRNDLVKGMLARHFVVKARQA